MEKVKNLLKNKVFLISAGCVIVLALILASVFLFGGKQPPNIPTAQTTSSNTSSAPLVLESGELDASSSDASSLPSGEKEISLEVSDSTSSASSTVQPSSSKAEEPAKPITPVKPQEESSTGGIQIGGEEQEEPYQCGSPNHHCEGPETHAFTLNLELEGCSICGSHSCPSFYATDEWGYTCLDITKCPKYDEKKDPLKYCQDCGKKPGDGRNGTCVQFIQAANCPNCGEFVEARTCHTCQ